MKKRVVLAIVCALVLGACSGSGGEDTTTTQPSTSTTASPQTSSSPSDSGGDEATVTIADFAFSGPASVEVGTTVTVVNEDSFGHTWTAEGGVWDSGTLSQGDSFEFTFEEPGEYDYFCAIHPAQMTGTIIVEG